MGGLFHDIKEALEEAIQHASGEPTNVRVRTVEISDVTAERSAQPETAPEAGAFDAAQAITKAV
jgi:hypothetical protein